jgi:hypothetical protein
MVTPTKELTPERLRAFVRILTELSPENLMMDGERSLDAARRIERSLRARWAALETELGRTVTEDEILGDVPDHVAYPSVGDGDLQMSRYALPIGDYSPVPSPRPADGDCTCPSKPSWGVWPYLDATGLAPVAYFGQVRSDCGLTMRWRCEHRHPDRDSARACAQDTLSVDACARCGAAVDRERACDPVRGGLCDACHALERTRA